MSKQRTRHVSAGAPARAITARSQRCVAQAFVTGFGDCPDFGQPCSSVSVRNKEVLAKPETPRDNKLTVQQHSLLRQERRRQRQQGRRLQSCPRNWDRCLKHIPNKPDDEHLPSTGDNISIRDFAPPADLHITTQTECGDQLSTGTTTTVTSPAALPASVKPGYSRPQQTQAPTDHRIEQPSEQPPALPPAVSDDANAHSRTAPKAKPLSTTAVATWLASISDQNVPISSRELTSNQLGLRTAYPSAPRMAQAPTPRKHKVSGLLPVLFPPRQSGGMLDDLVTMTQSVSEVDELLTRPRNSTA